MLVSGEALLGIALVELGLVIVPGPNMIYLISRSIAQGRRAGLISLAGSIIAGAIVLNARGFAPFPESGVYRTLALSLLVLGLWALIGLGAGILIPNQVAALLISMPSGRNSFSVA